MWEIARWISVALSSLLIVSSAQAEPISDQGLVRSFVEAAAYPGKKLAVESRILPAGMKQALSVASLFAVRDVENEGLGEYDCRGNAALPLVILQLKPTVPEAANPRVF